MSSNPFTTLRFWVEVEGEIKAAFAIVQGLAIEVQIEDTPEGGYNQAYHKRVKGVHYSNLVLKQGMTTDDYFWQWIDQVRNGQVVRRTITVILYEPSGSSRLSYSFLGAFPVKWVGPELQADRSEIALQTLEFAHEGLIKNK